MLLDLTNEEAAALFSLLDRAIADDRYPLSPRIRLLRAIRAKLPGAPLEPPPARRTPGRAPRAGRRQGKGSPSAILLVAYELSVCNL